MSEHSRLGFSDSGLWMVCAVWPEMVKDVGDEETPAIAFGNDSHKHLEHMMIGEFASTSSEESECAKVTYDYAQDRWLEMGVEDTECHVEEKTFISSTGRDDLGGTPDIGFINPREMEVIDHKTGAGTYVCEKNSSQLKLCALGLMEKYNVRPPVIKLTISQPRYWGNEDKIRTLETTPEALEEWLMCGVVPACDRTDDPNAVGTVTDKCKKCAGRHVCKYRDQAVAKGLTGKKEISTMAINETDVRKNQDVTVYDNERLGEVLLLVPVIRDYCDALEEHAKEIILKGEHVPNFKVVASSGKPKWLDEEAVMEALKGTQSAKKAYAQKLRTPTQVLATKPSAKLAKTLEGLIGTSGGGKSLVLESDKRESIAPKFDAVEAVPEVQPDGITINQEIPAELPAFLL